MKRVKNPQIIHMLVGGMDRFVYLCNKSVTVTRKKGTFLDHRVTCKNCLRILKLYGYRGI